MTTRLNVGDLVVRPINGLADHYGIYVGNGRVVDILKTNGTQAFSRLTDIATFAARRRVRVETRPDGVDESAVLQRAQGLLEHQAIAYDLLGLGKGFNCEHLARWVQTGGKPRSTQVEAVKNAALLVGAAAAVLAVVKAIADADEEAA